MTFLLIFVAFSLSFATDIPYKETVVESENTFTSFLDTSSEHFPISQDITRWISITGTSVCLSWSERFSVAINRAVDAYALRVTEADFDLDVISAILHDTTKLRHEVNGLKEGGAYAGRLEALVGPHYWPYQLLDFNFTTPSLVNVSASKGFKNKMEASILSDLEDFRTEVTIKVSEQPFKLDGLGPRQYLVELWDDGKPLRSSAHVSSQTAKSANNGESSVEMRLGDLPPDRFLKASVSGVSGPNTNNVTLSFMIYTGRLTAGKGVFETGGVDGCFSALQVRCPNADRCISPYWICDGSKDCPDGSDEVGCNAQTDCSGRFKCWGSDICLPKSWRCDGFQDCADGEDEWGCGDCLEDDMLRCNIGSDCVSVGYACDGQIQCPDGWDESDAVCNFITSQIETKNIPFMPDNCEEETVSCGFAGDCIHYSSVCNGIYDCFGGEDESPLFCSLHKSGYVQLLSKSKNDTFDPQDSSINSTSIGKLPSLDIEMNDGNVNPLDIAEWDKQVVIKEPNSETKIPETHVERDLSSVNQEFTTKFSTKPHPSISPSTKASSLILDNYYHEVVSYCRNDEFDCGDGWCVPEFWLCDGRFDCLNGEDEEESLCKKGAERDSVVNQKISQNSLKGLCSHNELPCSNGKCIKQTQICDGISDCPEKEDELSCHIVIKTTNLDEADKSFDKNKYHSIDGIHSTLKPLVFIEENKIAEFDDINGNQYTPHDHHLNAHKEETIPEIILFDNVNITSKASESYNASNFDDIYGNSTESYSQIFMENMTISQVNLISTENTTILMQQILNDTNTSSSIEYNISNIRFTNEEVLNENRSLFSTVVYETNITLISDDQTNNFSSSNDIYFDINGTKYTGNEPDLPSNIIEERRYPINSTNHVNTKMTENSSDVRLNGSLISDDSDDTKYNITNEVTKNSNVTFVLSGVTSPEGYLVLSTASNKNVTSDFSTILVAIHVDISNGSLPEFVIHNENGQRYDYQLVHVVDKPLQKKLEGSESKNKTNYYLEKVITFRLESNGQINFVPPTTSKNFNEIKENEIIKITPSLPNCKNMSEVVRINNSTSANDRENITESLSEELQSDIISSSEVAETKNIDYLNKNLILNSDEKSSSSIEPTMNSQLSSTSVFQIFESPHIQTHIPEVSVSSNDEFMTNHNSQTGLQGISMNHISNQIETNTIHSSSVNKFNGIYSKNENQPSTTYPISESLDSPYQDKSIKKLKGDISRFDHNTIDQLERNNNMGKINNKGDFDNSIPEENDHIFKTQVYDPNDDLANDLTPGGDFIEYNHIEPIPLNNVYFEYLRDSHSSAIKPGVMIKICLVLILINAAWIVHFLG